MRLTKRIQREDMLDYAVDTQEVLLSQLKEGQPQWCLIGICKRCGKICLASRTNKTAHKSCKNAAYQEKYRYSKL